MVIESGRVVLAPALSATLMVKFDGPTVVGVPLMVPLAEFRLSPGGSAPSDIDQVRGATPPVETTAREYAVSFVPPGKVADVMDSAVIVTANSLDAVA